MNAGGSGGAASCPVCDVDGDTLGDTGSDSDDSGNADTDGGGESYIFGGAFGAPRLRGSAFMVTGGAAADGAFIVGINRDAFGWSRP